jgi:hypothetical protein
MHYHIVGTIIRNLLDSGRVTDPEALFEVINRIRYMKDWEVRGLIDAEKNK